MSKLCARRAMWPPLVVPAARIVVPAVVTALERGGDAQVADPVRATTDYGSAVRRHRKVVVVLAVSIALALSGLGVESASASTRSRLAVSSNPDRSNAVRLDGSTVKGQIYVLVRNSRSLRKVDFYLDSQPGKKPPVRRHGVHPLTSRGPPPTAQRLRTTQRGSQMDRTPSRSY